MKEKVKQTSYILHIRVLFGNGFVSPSTTQGNKILSGIWFEFFVLSFPFTSETPEW